LNMEEDYSPDVGKQVYMPYLSPSEIMDKWRELMNTEIEEIKRALEGYEKNDDGVWEKVREPLFSEEVISGIHTGLKRFVNAITGFGDVDEEYIRKKTISAANTLTSLVKNYLIKENIQDPVKIKVYEWIILSITDLVYSAGSWAKEGGWQKVFKSTEQIIRKIDETKGGGLGSWFGK